MAVVRLNDAHLAYGDTPLLKAVSFAIAHHDRVALIGRNGAGKSSLMKVLAGTEKLDGGDIIADSSIRTCYLDQQLPAADATTVFDFLAGGLASLGKLLGEYESLTRKDMTDKELATLQQLQDEIDTLSGWDFQQRIHAALADLKLEPVTLMQSLSGGWRKRLSIVRSMLSEPDLLLLDEPTNHLDIPAIEWLQKELQRFSGALVLISHDRRFLSEVSNRIFWLDRGILRQFDCDYTRFLEEKAHILSVEETQNALFDKQLAEEEKWIRQGIKARRTRNEGRVRALKALRKERAERVDVKGNVSMQIEHLEKSGKLVSEVRDVSFSYENRVIIHDANLVVKRGDKIGIVGRNGVGKTTLIKLILGELKPDTGSIKLGTKQQVAYFDQNRGQLDESKSVADNLAEGREFIDVQGKQKHVISYLGDFLFPPHRVRSPVSTLSGGEKNRLLLAKLFSKPANILVLDEPSNDLDIETLELLEELISDYDGTVFLISHDREFLDQIVTSTLFIETDGRIFPYVGGYNDLERQHGALWQEKKPEIKSQTKTTPAAASKKPAVKLSYKIQRELDELPGLIEETETAIEALESEMASPDFFRKPHEEVNAATAGLSDLQNRLEKYYDRWAEIEP